jgi:hypothetical protein
LEQTRRIVAGSSLNVGLFDSANGALAAALLREHNKGAFARQMVDSFRRFSQDLNKCSESFPHFLATNSKHLSIVAASYKFADADFQR